MYGDINSLKIWDLLTASFLFPEILFSNYLTNAILKIDLYDRWSWLICRVPGSILWVSRRSILLSLPSCSKYKNICRFCIFQVQSPGNFFHVRSLNFKTTCWNSRAFWRFFKARGSYYQGLLKLVWNQSIWWFFFNR